MAGMDGYPGGGPPAVPASPPAAPAAQGAQEGPPANDYRPRRTRDQQVIAGTRLPDLHPLPDPGSMEAIADELASWVATTGDAVALRIMASDTAPFAAKATEQQQAEFYALTLFLEDGSPNAQAWQSTYQRTGAYGLVEAVRGAEKWRRANGLPVQLPPAQGQPGAELGLSQAASRPGQTGGAGPAEPPAPGPAPSAVPPPSAMPPGGPPRAPAGPPALGGL
jgi:hypothetical protein